MRFFGQFFGGFFYGSFLFSFLLFFFLFCLFYLEELMKTLILSNESIAGDSVRPDKYEIQNEQQWNSALVSLVNLALPKVLREYLHKICRGMLDQFFLPSAEWCCSRAILSQYCSHTSVGDRLCVLFWLTHKIQCQHFQGDADNRWLHL